MASQDKKYSARYAARNAKARSLGYRSYYDYRIHGNGRIAPGKPAPTGEARSRLRGHRSRADMRRAIREGSLVTISGHSPRDSNGRYTWVEMTVVQPDGSSTTYRLTGHQLDAKPLGAFMSGMAASGGAFSPSPSLDISDLGGDDSDIDDDFDPEDYGDE